MKLIHTFQICSFYSSGLQLTYLIKLPRLAHSKKFSLLSKLYMPLPTEGDAKERNQSCIEMTVCFRGLLGSLETGTQVGPFPAYSFMMKPKSLFVGFI